MATELLDRRQAGVFVKHLDASIDDAALEAAFSPHGAVLEAKVTGSGRGVVMYADAAAAAAALRAMQGALLGGKQIQVAAYQSGRQQMSSLGGGAVPGRMSPPGSHRAGPRVTGAGAPPGGLVPTPPAGFCNVYIKGLSEGVSESNLEALFAPYGPITSAVVIRDSNGRPRGFGFVNFEREADAARAVAGLDGHVPSPGATPWTVTRAQTKSERQQEAQARLERERAAKAERQAASNLYVKNLEGDIDDVRLKELFTEFGDVRSCRVLRDDDGNSRSVGFVQYNSIEEAQAAIQGMNGRQVGARKIYVQVAQRKADRDKKAAAAAATAKAYEAAVGGSGEQLPAPAFIGMPYYHAMAQPFHFFSGPQGHPVYPPPFQMQGMMPAHMPMAGVPPGAMPPHGGFYVYPTAGPDGMSAAAVAFPPFPASPAANAAMMPPVAAVGPPSGKGPRPSSGYGGRGGVPRVNSTGGSSTGSGSKPSSKGGSPHTNASGGSNCSSDSLALSLQSASSDERNTILGEALFPLIDGLTGDPGLTPKVTGMLLELQDGDLLKLVDDHEALNRKVGEAVTMLRSQFAPIPVAKPMALGGRQPARPQGAAAGGGPGNSGSPSTPAARPAPAVPRPPPTRPELDRLTQGMQGMGLAA